jgi:hypothetical protein
MSEWEPLYIMHRIITGSCKFSVKFKKHKMTFPIQDTHLRTVHMMNGRRGLHHMVVGFTITCAISAYCEFESRWWWGVLDATLCDRVCQWLVTGRWFSPVSSTNKTDQHDIAELLLKVALNTITLTPIPERLLQFRLCSISTSLILWM